MIFCLERLFSNLFAFQHIPHLSPKTKTTFFIYPFSNNYSSVTAPNRNKPNSPAEARKNRKTIYSPSSLRQQWHDLSAILGAAQASLSPAALHFSVNQGMSTRSAMALTFSDPCKRCVVGNLNKEKKLDEKEKERAPKSKNGKIQKGSLQSMSRGS